MFWKKEKKLGFPVETWRYEEYYVVSSEDMAQLNDVNVKFEGVLTQKPVVEFYSAGWPWSISSRLIEEDHGHRTQLKVDEIVIYFKGPLSFSRGEKITIWGTIRKGVVQAKRLEGKDIIYQS